MLLFTGAMDYHANVDGVVWFSREILPRIQSQRPGTEFFIVGSNPGQEIRSLHNGNGITATGFVDDMRPYYRMADVCVIPLRLARGVQNKVLEAMAMAKAVVATPQAIQGISAKHGEHLLVADDSNAFCHAIMGSLRDDTRRTEMGLRAREFVKANYDWNATMSKLEVLLVESTTGSRLP